MSPKSNRASQSRRQRYDIAKNNEFKPRNKNINNRTVSGSKRGRSDEINCKPLPVKTSDHVKRRLSSRPHSRKVNNSGNRIDTDSNDNDSDYDNDVYQSCEDRDCVEENRETVDDGGINEISNEERGDEVETDEQFEDIKNCSEENKYNYEASDSALESDHDVVIEDPVTPQKLKKKKEAKPFER